MALDNVRSSNNELEALVDNGFATSKKVVNINPNNANINQVADGKIIMNRFATGPLKIGDKVVITKKGGEIITHTIDNVATIVSPDPLGGGSCDMGVTFEDSLEDITGKYTLTPKTGSGENQIFADSTKGRCLQFNNSTAENIITDFRFSGGQMSINVWFRKTGAWTGTTGLYSDRTTWGNTSRAQHAWDDNSYFISRNSNNSTAYNSLDVTADQRNIIEDGEWHMLTSIYDGNTQKWYLDKVLLLEELIYQEATIQSAGSYVLYFGSSNGASTTATPRAQMKYWTSYNRPLTEADMDILFAEPNCVVMAESSDISAAIGTEIPLSVSLLSEYDSNFSSAKNIESENSYRNIADPDFGFDYGLHIPAPGCYSVGNKSFKVSSPSSWENHNSFMANPISFGNVYFEIEKVFGTVMFGLSSATTYQSSHLGLSNTSWVLYGDGSLRTANSIIGYLSVGFTDGDRVGCRYNIDTGEIQFYVNGITDGVNWTLAPGTPMYPSVSAHTQHGLHEFHFDNLYHQPAGTTKYPNQGGTQDSNTFVARREIVNGDKLVVSKNDNSTVEFIATGVTRQTHLQMLHPFFTGIDDDPDYTILQSRGNGLGTFNYQAWDGNQDTISALSWALYVESWFGLQFPAPVMVTEYHVAYKGGTGADIVDHWLLQGFDGTDWVTIDTITGAVFVQPHKTRFVVSNPGMYISYRLWFDDIRDYPSFGQILFYGPKEDTYAVDTTDITLGETVGKGFKIETEIKINDVVAPVISSTYVGGEILSGTTHYDEVQVTDDINVTVAPGIKNSIVTKVSYDAYMVPPVEP